jgi:hypothetical protein
VPARTKRPVKYTTLAERCAIAIADAHWFRNLATRALRDGKPKAKIRAANARTAARIVLTQARRDVLMHRMIDKGAVAGRRVT